MLQYGGAEGKRHRLREGMMWEDDEEYYGGHRFLTYTPDIPFELVYPRGAESVRPDGSVARRHWMTVPQHFRLVNHQLAQVRDALALAQSLGRILILPRLVCGLDRYWAPHNGIIPGSATQLPLLECPADHIIDLERMQPEMLLREHTFLCNPRTPRYVLDSVREVDGRSLADPRNSVRNSGDTDPHASVKVLRLKKGSLPYFDQVGLSRRTQHIVTNTRPKP